LVKSESHRELSYLRDFQHDNIISPEELLTEEEIGTLVNQYLMSRNPPKLHGQQSINVAQDKLLLDTVSSGKSDEAGILEKKFMDIDEVTKRVVNSTKAWYKISVGDKKPIIR
jgi:hypothetical protein